MFFPAALSPDDRVRDLLNRYPTLTLAECYALAQLPAYWWETPPPSVPIPGPEAPRPDGGGAFSGSDTGRPRTR